VINPKKLSEPAVDLPAHRLRFSPEAFIVDSSGTG